MDPTPPLFQMDTHLSKYYLPHPPDSDSNKLFVCVNSKYKCEIFFAGKTAEAQLMVGDPDVNVNSLDEVTTK